MKHPHPHNFALELWTDLGAIGVLLFSSFLVFAGFATRHWQPLKGAVFTALMAAGFSHSMTGAGFLQGWWIASLAVAAIAFIGMNNQKEKGLAG